MSKITKHSIHIYNGDITFEVDNRKNLTVGGTFWVDGNDNSAHITQSLTIGGPSKEQIQELISFLTKQYL